MTRIKLTPEQAHVFSLPVVFTPKAWRQAVDIDQPKSPTEVAQRLAWTVKAAWQAFMQEPCAESVEFSIYRFPPEGGRSHRVFLALKAERVKAPMDDFWHMEISLKFEIPSA